MAVLASTPKHILRPRRKDAGPGGATRLCAVRRARADARGAGCTRTGVTGSEINPYHHYRYYYTCHGPSTCIETHVYS